jgi:hypothetical protein
MNSNKGYQRLDSREAPSSGGDTEMTGIAHDVDTVNGIVSSRDDSFLLKVLFKEKSFEISTVQSSSTIADLKVAIEAATTIPPGLQRLIHAGKQLKPDSKSLADFKIISGASVHCFPLPSPSTLTPVAALVDGTSSSSGNVAYNPLNLSATSATTTDVIHRPIHFDPYVIHTSREVKLWCLILMFLSGLTLFNNLSVMSTTGKK